MTDREYVRVNVTSLTSTPRYNEYGEQYAEVDMQLPSNLVDSSNIASARMLVTKAKLSMAKIPSFSCKVTAPPRYSNREYMVRTPFKLMAVPVSFGQSSGHIQLDRDPSQSYFKTYSDLKLSYVDAPAEHVNEFTIPNQAANIEISRGYHQFNTITQFLDVLSNEIESNIRNNSRTPESTSTIYNPGIFRINLNSDNTMSLDIGCFPQNTRSDTSFACYSPVPYNHSIYNTARGYSGGSGISLLNYYMLLSKISSYYQNKCKPDPYMVGVNEELYQKLFTLPFIKYRITSPLGDWDEPYIYFLDTRQCVLDIALNLSQWYRHPTESGDVAVQGLLLKYNFVESDAVSMSDLNSIVFTLDGVNFTNQILPVNINSTNRMDAQTTTLPAITYYFPVWSRPSDTSTELIIKEDNFTNGGPLTIDPNLLRQRNLRFKLYYITNSGDLREMFVPKENNITIQLCFEITRKEETTSMMV